MTSSYVGAVLKIMELMMDNHICETGAWSFDDNKIYKIECPGCGICKADCRVCDCPCHDFGHWYEALSYAVYDDTRKTMFHNYHEWLDLQLEKNVI